MCWIICLLSCRPRQHTAWIAVVYTFIIQLLRSQTSSALQIENAFLKAPHNHSLQFISKQNSLLDHQGKEFSLDSLEPFTGLFSPRTFIVINHNQNVIHKSTHTAMDINVHRGHLDDGSIILMSKNPTDSKINHIMIARTTGNTYFLPSTEQPGAFVTISNEDYDFQLISQEFIFEEDKKTPPTGQPSTKSPKTQSPTTNARKSKKNSFMDELQRIQEKKRQRGQRIQTNRQIFPREESGGRFLQETFNPFINGDGSSQECTSFHVISVAIFFDVEFCQLNNNDFDATISAIQLIVAAASLYYEYNLCARLQLTGIFSDTTSCSLDDSAFQGFDRQACGSYLDDFTAYGVANNDNLGVDSASYVHLFTGLRFGPNLGCSWTPGPCGSDFVYGVESMSFLFPDIAGSAFILAHELGHNLGASHDFTSNDPPNFIMEANFNDGSDGFSPESADVISRTIEDPLNFCVTFEPVTQPPIVQSQSPSLSPTPIPTSLLSTAPSIVPTSIPTSLSPTLPPSMPPTPTPTSRMPTMSPTMPPIPIPTSRMPTTAPTPMPSSPAPSHLPSKSPTIPASVAPTRVPTSLPPSIEPSKVPTQSPTTLSPTKAPSELPTSDSPTVQPTASPFWSTFSPSVLPSSVPTRFPTTQRPSPRVTTAPRTEEPTLNQPSKAPSSIPTTHLPSESSGHPTRQPIDIPSPTLASPSPSLTLPPTKRPTPFQSSPTQCFFEDTYADPICIHASLNENDFFCFDTKQLLVFAASSIECESRASISVDDCSDQYQPYPGSFLFGGNRDFSDEGDRSGGNERRDRLLVRYQQLHPLWQWREVANDDDDDDDDDNEDEGETKENGFDVGRKSARLTSFEARPRCSDRCRNVQGKICFPATTEPGLDRWFRVRYTVRDTLMNGATGRNASAVESMAIFVAIKENGQSSCLHGGFVACKGSSGRK